MLLAPPLDAEQAFAVVRRVQEHIASIQRIGDQAVKVGASVGIAFYPDHATTLEGLITGADQAMYRAKHGTPGGVALYAPLSGPPRASPR